ncbi:hypothetical protein E4P40_10960 [Blastococcus sp. CT_GayMR20]|uniref:hypothetical protein n=1 Tax=Blastococcus sp. CT_GayMR20 TaxID=2559609 RepID=UPI0010741197|nr:hypothetical protein [Blastococcus sp. CT_GayMR20]TFV87684.1 hypothetical protein E4P40_10960 [Blastococcus sp. CT_GayMR20]
MTETTAPLARRLRRYTTGAALIAFPLLMAVETAFDPALGGNGEIMYRASTEDAGALAVSGVFLLVIGLLMTPAGLGILHLARDRGAALANLGAVLAVLAGLRFMGTGIFYLVGTGLAGGDRAEMVAFVERVNSGWVLGVLVLGLAICAHLSVIVLPWAAWRAGLIGLWGPVVATVVVLVHFFLPMELAYEFATFGILAAVFGSLGVGILRMADAEWDATPAARPVRERLTV